VDHFLSEYGLFVACTLQCVLAGWVMRASELRHYVNGLSRWKVGRWWEWCIRYLIPAILLILLVSGMVEEVRPPAYGHYPMTMVLVLGWGWLVATLIAAFVVTVRRWRRPLR
jgi:NSS family neurotransmitter:Na+ symporter